VHLAGLGLALATGARLRLPDGVVRVFSQRASNPAHCGCLFLNCPLAFIEGMRLPSLMGPLGFDLLVVGDGGRVCEGNARTSRSDLRHELNCCVLFP